MHIPLVSLVSALSLYSSLVAAATTKLSVTCITKNGPKSTSTVKTRSNILTIPVNAAKCTTITPTYVITPRATTKTMTETKTSTTTLTLVHETDTFSITTTSTDTVFTTLTALLGTTVYVTSTSTTSPTTTIAAPANFVPIKSTFPNSAKRRSAGSEEAPIEHALEERSKKRGRVYIKDRKVACSPVVYPTAVTCNGVAKVITTSTVTKTAKTKTVTGTRPTSSVTTTITTVSTTTLTPVRASTTLSFSTNTTITQTEVQAVTTTSTATRTIEVIQPAATFYAACASNNIVNTVNGQGIINAFYDVTNGDDVQRLSATTPYDCCVICINTPKCGGTFYGFGQCILQIQVEEVCSQSNRAFDLLLSSGTDVFVSNGLCGEDGIEAA